MNHRSASDLNNQGVIFLQAGHFSKAKVCFKKTISVLRRDAVLLTDSAYLHCRNTEFGDMPVPITNDEDSGNDEYKEFRSSTIIASINESSPTTQHADRPPADDPHHRPCKRCKHASYYSGLQRNPAATPLGHAIWMKPSTNDPVAQTSVTMYNLALTMQRDGKRLQALQVYEMAHHLALKCKADHSPVLFVCLHNLKELYREMDNQHMFNKISTEMVKLLRIFTNSYEVFYLKLLSIRNGDGMAAAA
jgi:hypothetical protein